MDKKTVNILLECAGKIILNEAEKKHIQKYGKSITIDTDYEIVNNKHKTMQIKKTEIETEINLESVESTDSATTAQKKKGFFGKMTDNVNNKMLSVQKDAEAFMLENIIERIMPMLKKLLPKSKKDLADYLGNERIVIIKRDSNDDITITVFKKAHIEVNLKNTESLTTSDEHMKAWKEAVSDVYSLDDVVEKLVTGKMETIINK